SLLLFNRHIKPLIIAITVSVCTLGSYAQDMSIDFCDIMSTDQVFVGTFLREMKKPASNSMVSVFSVEKIVKGKIQESLVVIDSGLYQNHFRVNVKYLVSLINLENGNQPRFGRVIPIVAIGSEAERTSGPTKEFAIFIGEVDAFNVGKSEEIFVAFVSGRKITEPVFSDGGVFAAIYPAGERIELRVLTSKDLKSYIQGVEARVQIQFGYRNLYYDLKSEAKGCVSRKIELVYLNTL
ncbi:MAG: hypothetical protein OEM82_08970, partial [Acidobacteriota bacterium]|nr:hypothetical protein [Acidobacteriota bacterium]